MGHSVGDAAKRSTAKSEVKKKDDVIDNAKKIREIRSNLASGLAISNFFVQGLLEEYDTLLLQFEGLQAKLGQLSKSTDKVVAEHEQVNS